MAKSYPSGSQLKSARLGKYPHFGKTINFGKTASSTSPNPSAPYGKKSGVTVGGKHREGGRSGKD